MLECKVHQLARRPHAPGFGEDGVHPRVVLGVAEESAGHVGQHAQRDVLAVGHKGQVRGDGIVQLHLLLIGELQQHGRGKRLGSM